MFVSEISDEFVKNAKITSLHLLNLLDSNKSYTLV